MKLLQQNPAPALLTGHSPPASASAQVAPTTWPNLALSSNPTVRAPRTPRFQGLPENAVQQFISDTLGVWAPKVPLTRSKTQFFEDAFLELVEDGAFYFTLPIVGPLLGGLLNQVVTHNQPFKQWGEKPEIQAIKKSLDIKPPESPPWFKKAQTWLGMNTAPDPKSVKWLVGTPLREISAEAAEKGFKDELLRPLIATKMGALLGTVAVAAGFEYMIQHTKNVITAKQFKTKNFAAVAGLESGKAHTAAGQTDPVEKARKRSKQVGYFVLGSLALAVATPQAILHNEAIANAAKKFLHVADFGKAFDISKPVLALLIGTGVVSYVDAARDPLERKETATRLAVVAPYLMFGKELAGYAMAKFTQTFNVDVGNKTKRPLQDFAPFIKDQNPLAQAADFKKSFLDMDVVKSKADLIKELEGSKALAEYAHNPELQAQIRGAVIGEHSRLGVYSYLLSALVCGMGINWIVYKQTQKRYKLQQEALQSAPKQGASASGAQRAGLPISPASGLSVGGGSSLKPTVTAPHTVAQPLVTQPVAAFSGHPLSVPLNTAPASVWTAPWGSAQSSPSPFARPWPAPQLVASGYQG